MSLLRIFFLISFGLLYVVAPVLAQSTQEQDKTKQIWQLLDYLAIDYGTAVQNGKIISPSEYDEMEEFALLAERQLAELSTNAAQKELQQQALQLRTLIAQTAAATVVSAQAHTLASALLVAYPVLVSPTKAPNLKLGAQLFQTQCVSCHGQLGQGDGPLAASLTPSPTDLSEHDRAKERSLFSLYQIITEGVKGTAMPSFNNLSEDERWAIAFFAATLPYNASDQAAISFGNCCAIQLR